MAIENAAMRNTRIDTENALRDRDIHDMKKIMNDIVDQLAVMNTRLSAIETSMASFTEVKPKLDQLIKDDIERGGVAKAVKWFATGTVFAVLGAILSGIYDWFDVRFP